MSRRLIIGDTHCPYEHPLAWSFIEHVLEVVRPDSIVHLGDEMDAAYWSRFAKDPELPSGSSELDLARRSLGKLYSRLGKLQVDVCQSNHTMRPYLRALDAGLHEEFLKPINEILKAPKTWKWHTVIDLGHAIAFHGDGFSGPQAAVKAAIAYRRSVYIGHVHTNASVTHLTGPFDQLFAVNGGCLINPAHRAFSYAKHCTSKPSLGLSYEIDGVPYFFPMVLRGNRFQRMAKSR